MRRRLLLLTAVAGLLCAPGQARAAIPLAPCGETVGLECGTLDVPLDRTGVVPGTIGLHVEVLPVPAIQQRGVMFLIAGGPGQGSARSFDLKSRQMADLMQATFPGYTLVAFDNRGTGDSGVLRCPRLQTTVNGTAEDFAALARECADIIGPTRRFYATRDHAEDMEAVRVALGFGKIGLYGVSYGTKLALAYALAHGNEVERMVLDSVVPVDLPDPFDANVLHEMPNTLRRFCAGGFCRGATRDFGGDVVTLANALEARPISGKVRTVSGGSITRRMNGEDLVSMVEDSDLSPGLAAELPAAVHAARHGNTAPLLRVFDIDKRTSELSTEDLSFGLNAATTCADGEFPWPPDAPVSSRQAAIDAAVRALPPGSFGPFGSWGARTGTAYFCEQWPSPAGRAPLAPGPLPNVPVLLISGGYDMRTPTASAAAVASLFPQSHLLVVPGVGHSVLGADLSGCAFTVVNQWLLGFPVRAQCPRVPPLVKILGAFPRHVSAAPQSTLAAVGKDLHEAEASWAQVAFASTPVKVAGLCGGRLSANGQSSFTLTRYCIAPGLTVSGKISVHETSLPFGFSGTLQIGGSSAAHGSVRVFGRHISGTLGGRRVAGSA